ncbi:DUF1524 domain-containing protein [Streptomyces sp. NPDC006261]|uniref:DUF1524 domain-containing protein n=1 Tax=Streptomyces sp. NPDC006261 TaxID=3156739 RepID=UPI00339E8B37
MALSPATWLRTVARHDRPAGWRVGQEDREPRRADPRTLRRGPALRVSSCRRGGRPAPYAGAARWPPPAGAHAWTPERREAYANDLGADRSLVAVTAKTNRSKADRDPAQWMPPAESATCTYLVDWTATKLRWALAMDEAEKTALLNLAEPCADSVVQYEPAS